MVQHYLEDIVLLDDATILAGLRFAVERMKQVLEPAGAAALAAVLAGRIPIRDGERVAVVLSGGNVAVERLGDLLAAARTAARGGPVTRRTGAARAGSRAEPADPPSPPEPAARPVEPLAHVAVAPPRRRRRLVAARPAGPPVDPAPSTRRLIGASFDLLSRSSEEMRRASFYIGAIVLGTAGGYALAFWALEVVSVHSTDRRDRTRR